MAVCSVCSASPGSNAGIAKWIDAHYSTEIPALSKYSSLRKHIFKNILLFESVEWIDFGRFGLLPLSFTNAENLMLISIAW